MYLGLLAFLASVGSLAHLSQRFLGTLCRHCVGPWRVEPEGTGGAKRGSCRVKVRPCWVAHGMLQHMSVLYFVVAIASATSTWHMLGQRESFDPTPREKGVCQLDLMLTVA